jgi:hypothetical protein
MPLFGRKKNHQDPSTLSRRSLPMPPPGWKPPPRRKLTREQEERERLEDYAAGWELDFEDDEELVHYIYRHVAGGGHFVVKKVINKRAVRLLRVVEVGDYPTENLVTDIALRHDGPGPGTYVVLPAGSNKILARYEVVELW